MFVWRLTRKAYAGDALDGEGSRRHGGRWNHVGSPMVYASGTLSLCVLEYLVNVSVNDLPNDLVSIQIQLPENLPLTKISFKELPSDWRSFPSVEALKDIGTDWVADQKTAVLVVPSAVIPNELNYLINPLHPRTKDIRIEAVGSFTLDPRLFNKRRT